MEPVSRVKIGDEEVSVLFSTKSLIVQLAGAVEYTDCTSADE